MTVNGFGVTGSGNILVEFQGSGLTSALQNSLQVWYGPLRLWPYGYAGGTTGHYSLEWAGVEGNSFITGIRITETPDILAAEVAGIAPQIVSVLFPDEIS